MKINILMTIKSHIALIRKCVSRNNHAYETCILLQITRYFKHRFFRRILLISKPYARSPSLTLEQEYANFDPISKMFIQLRILMEESKSAPLISHPDD